MDAHDSEFKEFLVPVAVGLPFHGFDIVIGALHRTWRNGMIVPSQDAEPEFSHGISNLHQWANLWHSCKGIQWEKKASQVPHQLPEIERCAGHEQIDGVTDRTFEKIPSHSMIVLEVV